MNGSSKKVSHFVLLRFFGTAKSLSFRQRKSLRLRRINNECANSLFPCNVIKTWGTSPPLMDPGLTTNPRTLSGNLNLSKFRLVCKRRFSPIFPSRHISFSKKIDIFVFRRIYYGCRQEDVKLSCVRGWAKYL